MNNQPQQSGVSFGSGGPLIGAPASAILGMPGGLQQQSPSSAGFTPGLLPSPPQASPAPQMAQVPGSQPNPSNMPPPQVMPQNPGQGAVGLPPSNPEAMAIVKSLAARLNTISKAEELQKTQGA